MNAELKLTEAEQGLLSLGKNEEAAKRLRERGLPTRRVEAWHYTDLRNLLKSVPAGEADKTVDVEALLANYRRLTHATRLPFVDGKFISDAADKTPNGVLVAKEESKSGQPSSEDDAIGLISAIAGAEGASVSVKDGTDLDTPLGLAHVIASPVFCSTVNNVIVGKGAEVSFIERHLSEDGIAGQANAITNLKLGEGAEVLWAIVQQHGNECTHLGQLNVELAADSELTILVLNCGGKLVRQEVHVNSNGENSELEILGVNLVGNDTHVDVTTSLSHNVPHTTAEETFRNVVTGNGAGVFQGQICVAQPAQKTDAQMACNTLLLSDEAEFSAKPELEIFADDVVCAHGATVTDIDDDHLFYMRARGIRETEARALLVKAFVDEIFDELEDELFKEALVGLIDNWLDRNG